MERINLKGLSLKDLEAFALSIDEKKYRGRQLFYWLYNKDVETFEQMTTVSKSLRNKLKEAASIDSINLLTFQRSSNDNTTKFLFELSDGKKIESVLIPPRTAFENSSSEDEDEQKRLTLCVSTQVGCPLHCIFCASGTMGFFRNLTSGEILDQYLQIKKIIGKKITNIVFMGMGEPLLNYENVMNSINIFSTGMNIASRRITLSTSGWVDGIKRMADEKKKVKLAVSLHSLNDNVRTALMPLNKKYNVQKLLEAIQYYYQKTKMRVTFEYILFAGTNDSVKDVKDLIKLAKSVPCKINIIPFHRIDFSNPIGLFLKLSPASVNDTEKFANALRRNHISVFIRSSAGKDIAAACGQLVVKGEQKPKLPKIVFKH